VIRRDEWLAELDRLYNESITTGDGEAMTLTELCGTNNHSRPWWLSRIRQAMASRQWECIRVCRTSISGNITHVPAYRPIHRTPEATE